MPMPPTLAPAADSQTEVLVIGGGPGGSTAAAVLAEKGWRVVLLEKARHPRFHIGESLLPANLPLMERLGVADQVRAIGMEKWGAEFVSHWDGRSQEFAFARSWDKSLPMAYQVRRSEFDEILIRRAAQLGVRVIEGFRVRDAEFAGPAHARRCVRVNGAHDDGRRESWTADYVIDASGRDALLSQLLKARRRDKKHSSAALYAHFAGARRDAGRRAGNVTIYWFDHGWFWFIPLADGATSVGAVVWPYYMKSRRTPVREFFLATIAMCPPLAERLSDATLVTDVEATGNYSYACDHSHGLNYLLVGDAFSFIDPVFSSGVMLAMNGGLAAADAIEACRANPERAAAALQRYDRIARHGPKQFSWFIHRLSNPTMRGLFLGPRNVLRMEEALLSLLAGDIFGSTPIWGRLRLFKAMYYLISLAHLGRSLRAWRARAVNIRSEPEHVTGG